MKSLIQLPRKIFGRILSLLKSLVVRMLGKIVRRMPSVIRSLKNSYERYLDISASRKYHAWAVDNESGCFVDENLEQKVLISVVVPVYNPEKADLLAMVYSVVNQHYQNWELLLINASSDPEAKIATEACSQIDTRIKVITPKKNMGISENTNQGIQAATGEFLGFLDHDDLLHPCAIHASMAYQEHQNADLIYSDEDKVNADGTYYFGPHCKPDWSPHLQENVNYINHFTLVRSKYAKGVGGLRSECDGAQDFDFLWRVIDKYDPLVTHVPRVLYHWRAAQSSTAHDIATKKYIFEAGKKALQDHLDRKKIAAKAHIIVGKPGFYKVEYEKPTGVSIIIGQVEKMRRPGCVNWLSSLLEDYDTKTVDVLIGDWFEPYRQKFSFKGVQTIKADSYNDYLKKAAHNAKHEAVVVFQEAAIPREKTFLFDLAAAALRSNAPAVQPIVVGPDDTIIDAGLVDAPYGFQPLFKGLKLGKNSFFGNTDWVRDISGVNGMIFATTRTQLPQVTAQRIGSFVLPVEAGCVLWAHAVFEWQSRLQQTTLKYFSPLLGQAMFEIRMHGSKWNQDKDRVDE